MDRDAALNVHNLAFLEGLYEAYEQDPNSVDPSWRALIERELAAEPAAGASPREDMSSRLAAGPAGDRAEALRVKGRLDAMINAYRLHGHLGAKLDPLERPRLVQTPQLDPSHFGLEQELDRVVPTRLMPGANRVRDIVTRLQNTYCRHVGVEYWHLSDPEERAWLRERMEGCENQIIPSQEDQKHLLRSLATIENVDAYLHQKFLGAKRFSISGAESVIALLDCLIEEAGNRGVGEVILGMAHRGRLNVLMTILGKSPYEVFSEFAHTDAQSYLGSGDVKYHLGYHREYTTRAGKDIYLALAFNPSHLEAITPVIQGRVRAKQDSNPNRGFDASLGVTLHGDAAFAGQGVVAETLNMSQLPGYGAGGVIRVVINNQIGFTTEPHEGRSGVYCTDAAHILQVPVFHVNGDDPEAAAYVAQLAVQWRQKFRRDVIIDLTCYRRFGHNEGDDPSFTQPQMYQRIAKHPSVRKLYQKRLLERGTVSEAACKDMDEKSRREFDEAHAKMRSSKPKTAFSPMHGVWKEYAGGEEPDRSQDTQGLSAEKLEAIGEGVFGIPDDFAAHRKIKRFYAESLSMCRGEKPLNWATAELLAYGSLLDAGHPVRLSGQDAMRGTFSHRHCVLTDTNSGRRISPLSSLGKGGANFEVYNSPLSEFSVLGFEFGYSLISPHALTIWEAQFGDFANGAQVIIDQFLSSSEDKWNRISGLVLMLPHGYEGQGPEHSSARLERFLQLCAEDNMQVCYLTTPAQNFHVLRRQVLSNWRKPLVLMTPKSLLRFRPSFSDRATLLDGQFQKVIDDESFADKPGSAREKVTRILLSAGKIYYDLDERRQSEKREDVAIIRVEQLYPWPDAELKAALARYPNAKSWAWCQEEPKNMGSWSFTAPRLAALVESSEFDTLLASAELRYAGREASASPATGSAEAHQIERERILDAAFAP